MPTRLVSIIIPAYNAAPWLRETLDSAVSQTFQSREIIVVNDGSTDATAAIAEGYADRGVRLVSQPNRGLSAARNAGLEIAQGDYIQYLDADDLLSPDKIEQQVALLAHAPPGTLATGRWARFRKDVTRARLTPSAHWRDQSPMQYIAYVARTGSTVPVHAWLLPRPLVDRIGPFVEDLRVMEDHEYFMRAVLASTGLRFSAQGCSYYRTFHARTLSRDRDFGASTSMFRSVELMAERLLRPEADPALRSVAADYYQWLAYKLYPDRPELVRIAEQRVASLGGSTATPRMGRKAGALARLIGWKSMQRLRAWLWRRGIYLGKNEFISD
jgi:glycosyltransferase involved in cell wall biosynthesis